MSHTILLNLLKYITPENTGKKIAAPAFNPFTSFLLLVCLPFSDLVYPPTPQSEILLFVGFLSLFCGSGFTVWGWHSGKQIVTYVFSILISAFLSVLDKLINKSLDYSRISTNIFL